MNAGKSRELHWASHAGLFSVVVVLGLCRVTTGIAQIPAAPKPEATPAQPDARDGQNRGLAAVLQRLEQADRKTPELRYRLFYISNQKLTELAGKDSGKDYLPVKRTEFERLLRESNSETPGATAHIAAAQSVAELQDGQLVNAQTRLQVAHRGSAPELLPLDSFRLALTGARWQNDGGEQPAILGLNAAGQTVVVVERPGELWLDWSARGKRSANGEIAFQLALPAAPIHWLDLDLADGLMPSSESGLVTRAPAASATESSAAEELPVLRPTRWRVELCASSALDLKIVPQVVTAASRQLLLLGPVLDRYEFTTSGVELTTTLPLDPHHEPLESVTLQLAAELHLTAIKSQDQDLAWTELPSHDKQFRRFRVRPHAAGSEIHVGALAPLETDRPWKLPTIRLEEGLWREGEATLRFAPSLVLQRLDTTGCRELAPAKKDADAFLVKQVRYYDQQAVIEANLGHRETILWGDRGTTIRPTPGTSSAEVAILVRSEWGEQFTLSGEVPESWIVESVETDPKDALEDWEVGLTTDTRNGPRQQLRVRLADAVTPARPVLVNVRCSKTTPAGEPPVDGKDLPLVNFARVSTSREMLCIHVGTSHAVQVESDPTVRRLDPADLSAADHKLIQLLPNDVLLTTDDTFRSVQVLLREEPARYTAEIAVDVRVQRDEILEVHRIRCAPQSSPLRAVVVQVSESSPTPIEWTLGGSGEISSATRLATDPVEGGSRMEKWEIVLSEPRAQPFDLQGTRRHPARTEHSVALASLPNAASQTGTLTVRSLTGDDVTIVASDLQSIPPPPLREYEQPVVRGTFRYNPGTDSQARIVTQIARAESPNTRAWSSQILSQLSADGLGIHDHYFRLENLGRNQVVVQLPENVTLLSVRVENQELTTVGPSRRVTIPLPEGIRYPTLHLLYTTPGDPLGAFAALDYPNTAIDVPVMQQRWSIALPPGHAVSPDQLPDRDKPTDFRWQERLFGPLGRAAREAPVVIPAFSDWAGADPPGSPAYEFARRDSLRALDRLGTLLRDRPTSLDGSDTWGTLLQSYPSTLVADPTEIPRLLVDAAALARCGVIPATPVPRVTTPDARQAASRLLRQFGLVLRGDSGFVLLTSAANIPASHRPADVPAIARGSGESLLSRRPDLAGGYVDLDDWAVDAAEELPWNIPFRVSQATAGGGWAFYDVSDLLDRGGQVSVYRPEVIEAWAWAAFVAAVGLVLAWSGKSMTRWVLTAAPIAVAALLVPGVLVPATAALFLGVLVGGILALLQRRRAPELSSRSTPPDRDPADFPASDPQSSEPPSSDPAPSVVSAASGSRTSRLGFGLVILGVIVANTWAQDVETQPGPVYEVLIPVDDKDQPGDYFYLPEAFYKGLRDTAAKANAAPQGWLIRDAQYHCQFDAVAGDRMELGDLTVTYTIEVLQPQQRIQLPLRREGLQLSEAYHERRPLPINWSADGTKLEFTLLTPGTTKVQLGLRPSITVREGVASFSVGIPPVARSELRIEVPDDARGLEVPTAIGSTVLDEEEGALVAQLGPARQLVVQWPQNPATGDAASDIEVRQLIWLRVRPGTVLVDAKFHFTVHSGKIDQVSLLAASGLRRLRPEDNPQIFEVPRYQQPELKTVHLPVPEGAPHEFTIRATFFVTNTSGVGKLVLPTLRSVTGLTTERLLAVSVSDELESRPEFAPTLDAVPVAEFLDAWDETEPPPNLAFRLPNAEFPWGLSTRFHQPVVTADQELNVGVGLATWDVEYQANVETTGGTVLQYRLRVPANLQVLSAELISEALRRTIPWARDASGALTMFFDRPVAGQHALLIRGVVSRESTTDPALVPWLTLEGATVRSSSAYIHRRPEADVRISEEEGTARMTTEPLGAYRKGFGRLVAAIREATPGEMPPVKIDSSANQPHVSGRLFTTIDRESGLWTARARCELSVRGGLLDLIRVEIPGEWTDPIAADERFRFEVQPVPGRNRQLVVVRPALAIQDHFEFEIRGDVAASSAQHNLLPELALLDADPVERLVALPSDSQQRLTALELSDLVPVAPPSPVQVPQGFELYHASPRSRAVTRALEKPGVPSIHLADIHAVIHHGEQVFGVASYDLDPAGQEQAELSLPDGYRIFSISVDGTPSVVTPNRDGTCKIPLGASQLPRRIEVFFEGPTGQGSLRTMAIRAPGLVGIETEHTLWSIYGARSSRGADTDDATTGQVSSRAQDQVRLRTAATIIEANVDALVERPQSERENWYRAWLIRYVARARPLRAALPERDPLTSELATIEARQLAVAGRLSASETYQSVLKQAGVTNVHAFVMDRLNSGREPWRVSLAGGHYEVVLPAAATREDHPFAPYYGASAVVLVLALGSAFSLQRRLQEWVIQYPYTVVVLAGLVWWLWMAPSWAGWLIMAAGACGALRPSWKSRRASRAW